MHFFFQISYLSASSVFSTHPQPLDQTGIQSSDVMIMNSLTEAPTVIPEGMLREFCNSLSMLQFDSYTPTFKFKEISILKVAYLWQGITN